MALKIMILIGWSLMNWALMIIYLETVKNPRRSEILNIALAFFVAESVSLGFMTTAFLCKPYEVDSIITYAIIFDGVWACLIVKYGEKIVRYIDKERKN